MILADSNVGAVNHIVAMYVGASEVLLEADLDLSERLSTVEIEKVLDSLEDRVRTSLPDIERVRVLLNSP